VPSSTIVYWIFMITADWRYSSFWPTDLYAQVHGVRDGMISVVLLFQLTPKWNALILLSQENGTFPVRLDQ
jgi:hypothetical protein